MMRVHLVPAIVLVLALAGAEARAETVRYALLVANHSGGANLPRLRYAGRDASRLSDVLTDVGGYRRNDVVTIVDGDAAALLHALDEFELRIHESHTHGDDAVLLVYYSGHAQAGVLRMGDSTLPLDELRMRIDDSTAEVRLAFIDSCGAGAITQDKGGALDAPFVVQVQEAPGPRGEVFITSSSADEPSQESDDIQGSTFTHHLTSALRGGGDEDRDGRVTLNEAYAYTYGRTVAATSGTRSGAQHPSYRFELQGHGDVVLSRPGDADVVVEFPEAAEGRFFVVDLDRQLFVAEVDKARGGSSRIALPRGQYAIKKRTPSHLLLTRVQARDKGTFVVDEDSMTRVAFADDFAKGSPILDARITRSVHLDVRMGLGAQMTLDSVDNGNLFPALSFVVVQAHASDVLRLPVPDTWTGRIVNGLDLGIGGVDAVRTVDAGAAGALVFPVHVTQLQLGASTMWVQPLDDWLQAEVDVTIGARLAALYLQHDFVDAASVVARQSYLTFTPGLIASLGWRIAGPVRIDAMARASWLPYNVDDVRQLAALDVVGSVGWTW